MFPGFSTSWLPDTRGPMTENIFDAGQNFPESILMFFYKHVEQNIKRCRHSNDFRIIENNPGFFFSPSYVFFI